MSLIVEKIRKKDAFDSQRTAALCPAMRARRSSFRRGGDHKRYLDLLQRRSKSGSLAMFARATSRLFELNHGPLDMLTHRTFKGPKVVPRLLRLNARQIHLCRACWAGWSYDDRTVFRPVLGKCHLRLPCLQAGAKRTLSHRRLDRRSLSAMYLN
jgi:hypothetical protein